MIAHYITDSSFLEHSVLALQELDGEHSGQNQAESVIRVINDYGIALKVGYFVMDNASNNDTMIEALSTCTYTAHLQTVQLIYGLYSSFTDCTAHLRTVQLIYGLCYGPGRGPVSRG